MDALLKKGRRRRNRRGQTTIEWLLLMAMAFGIGYLMITGPIASATRVILTVFRLNLVNVVHNGKTSSDQNVEVENPTHPSRDGHFKPLHQ